MKIKAYVKYNNINKPNPEENANIAEFMEIRKQMLNDLGWGSGTSDFKSVKRLFGGKAEWEKYRPSALVSEDNSNSFVVEFDEKAFNFPSEGINHFIGTIAGDILLNNKIKGIVVDDFWFELKKEREGEIITDIFPGPNYGIDGVYELFNYGKGYTRPLLAYSIKPRMGYDVKQFKQIFKQAAKGGADIIEDDERMVDPTYCPLEDRMKCAAKIQKKQKRRYKSVYYSTNITGPLDSMKLRVDLANKYNIKFVKVDVMVVGFDALLSLTKYIKKQGYNIRITCYLDAIGKYRDLSRNFVCKMARLCGVDIIYTGSPNWNRYDKISEYFIYECERLFLRHENLRNQEGFLENIKPALASVSNDLSAQCVELITLVFNRCFKPKQNYSSKQFVFYIGRDISASNMTVREATNSIHARIIKAANAQDDDYEIRSQQSIEKAEDDYSQYDIKKLIEYYRKGY